jgi:CheY-like chemotaxis protein
MAKPLKVLIVEDSEDDTQMILRELKRGGYEPVFERVDTPAALSAALEKKEWDVVLSDYVMPQLSGLDALGLFRAEKPQSIVQKRKRNIAGVCACLYDFER